MLGRMIGLVALLVLLVLQAPSARAQAALPQALANELLETMHYKEQVSAILPGIMKAMKPSVVQGRAEIDREYDVLDDNYAKMLVQEILPAVGAKYNLTNDPAGRSDTSLGTDHGDVATARVIR